MKLIPLCGIKGKGKFAIIDDEDINIISGYKWYLSPSGYAEDRKYIKGRGHKHQRRITYKMHRIIVNCPKGLEVDHINHNKLDNQKENLRIVTRSQNNWNSLKTNKITSSIYKGVCWAKRDKKWIASITLNDKGIYIGLFEKEKEAAKAYNKKAKELFGNFANLNFIQS